MFCQDSAGDALLAEDVSRSQSSAGQAHNHHGNKDGITGLGVGSVSGGAGLSLGVADHNVDVHSAGLAHGAGVDAVVLGGVGHVVGNPVALSDVQAIIADAVAVLGGVVVLDHVLDLAQGDNAIQSGALGDLNTLVGAADQSVLVDVQVNGIGELVAAGAAIGTAVARGAAGGSAGRTADSVLVVLSLVDEQILQFWVMR